METLTTTHITDLPRSATLGIDHGHDKPKIVTFFCRVISLTVQAMLSVCFLLQVLFMVTKVRDDYIGEYFEFIVLYIRSNNIGFCSWIWKSLTLFTNENEFNPTEPQICHFDTLCLYCFYTFCDVICCPSI